MANVQITLNVFRSFHRMLKKIAGGLGRTVEDCSLRTIVSFVEAVQDGGADLGLVGGCLPEIDCDPQLLALAMGAKKKAKPFISKQEIQGLGGEALGGFGSPGGADSSFAASSWCMQDHRSGRLEARQAAMSIVKVPVAPDLQEEIRKVMGQLEADHVDLPHLILALVRAGLRVKKQLAERWHKEFPASVANPECRIIPFPRRE